jgi:hypothetical protein
MSRPDRVLLASLLVALAAWASGCGGPPSRSGTACSSDDECRPDARCSSHSCVLNAPPLADFAISGELRASSVVTLDGSGSRDPDGGDAITSYSWRIDPDGASCPAPEVASTDAVVQVRFGCAGQFRASLVVLDGKHVESAPATRPLQIEARNGPAMVEAGPDQSVNHLCSGTTPTCRLAAAIQLTARATTQVNVSFHWTVQPPPGRALDEHRRVRFLPDANAQNPTVEIETDGTAISGDWQFRIEVRDPVGVLDADVTRVSVANQPPVIQGGPPGAFDHLFDASTRLFTAAGAFPVEVADPDGDPVERQIGFHHAGDGGAAFLGQDLGTSVSFAVAVPFTAPGDALFLEGAEGLDRSIVIAATDVNGATADATYPVEITNRPPVLARGGELSALHSYDPASRRFLSQPSVGQWLDPDGDPLSYTASADPECPTSAVGADGTVRMQCSRPFTGVGSLPGFLQERQALLGVRDPWAAAADTVAFRIGNRAPVAVPGTFRPSVRCDLRSVTGPWCPGTGSGLERANHFPSALVYPPPGAADPDGDPLDVKPGSGPAVSCNPDQPCVLTALTPDSISCDFSPPDTTVPFVATDGVASSSGSVLVDPVCW